MIATATISWSEFTNTVWLGTIGDETRYRVIRVDRYWRVMIRKRTAAHPGGAWTPLLYQRCGNRQPSWRRFSVRADAVAACERHAGVR